MDFFEKLNKLDRRWVYLILAVIVVITTVFLDYETPIRISPEVKAIYDFVESRPQGSYIHLAIDYDPGSLAEMHPMTFAIMEQALARGLKIVMTALSPNGPGMAEQAMLEIMDSVRIHSTEAEPLLPENLDSIMIQNGNIFAYIGDRIDSITTKFGQVIVYGKEAVDSMRILKGEEITYEEAAAMRTSSQIVDNPGDAPSEDAPRLHEIGETVSYRIGEFDSVLVYSWNEIIYGDDITFLGYKPYPGIVILSMGQNYRISFPNDYYNTLLDNIPMMKDITNYDDVEAVILITGTSGVDFWISYANGRYNVPLAVGLTGVMAADYYPYLRSGQIFGIMGGMLGAAEYEKLVNRPMRAVEAMRPQVWAHVVIILFILVGNIGFLVSRRKGGAQL
jgi:hypothetical protein